MSLMSVLYSCGYLLRASSQVRTISSNFFHLSNDSYLWPTRKQMKENWSSAKISSRLTIVNNKWHYAQFLENSQSITKHPKSLVSDWMIEIRLCLVVVNDLWKFCLRSRDCLFRNHNITFSLQHNALQSTQHIFSRLKILTHIDKFLIMR